MDYNGQFQSKHLLLSDDDYIATPFVNSVTEFYPKILKIPIVNTDSVKFSGSGIVCAIINSSPSSAITQAFSEAIWVDTNGEGNLKA